MTGWLRKSFLVLPLALAACSLGKAATPAPLETPVRAMRIVSLDYCADQYVLKLVDKSRILALSPDATRSFSYMRGAASGMPKVAPRAEDVLVLKPDLVLRSYGGGADAGAFFARAGVPVLQLGYAEDLAGVRRVLVETADALGERVRGERIAREMDARVARLSESKFSPFVPSVSRDLAQPLRTRPSTSRHGREVYPERLAYQPDEGLGTNRGESDTGLVSTNASKPTLLYATPGGVTSGPGSLIHELIELAGYRNFQTAPGWQPLPLERLAYEKPDRVAMAWFGRRDYNPDQWSAARHPLMRSASEHPVIGLEGAWTACGGWFVLDAAEAMARARGTQP
ncbi:ABC transporter substrate-binding protein [Blastomonas natatoria]|uniref:ABC transporter substrate-binding protein n=1 Tax=Blastomonas natatoria TaxID=34015 RepID=UPI001FC9B516|nr:ABC transporter substrate-binding protein [Blastomonas natatoria]